MSSLDPIVDIAEDAVEARRRKWRALLRLGVPMFGVVLVIVAILGNALFSYAANRRGALALSDDLLSTLNAHITERVNAFLDPCERLLALLNDIAAHMPRNERKAAMLQFAESAMKQLPQVASVYAGNDKGDFLMLRRLDDGGRELKEISSSTNGRYVTFVDYDQDGKETARRSDPGDTFDPRTRPWYEGALRTSGAYWTGIYVFFTTRKPGITVSARFSDPEGAETVVGVDITLEDLSQFVDSLAIGKHGRAIIMDGDGQLIATGNTQSIAQPGAGEALPSSIDGLSDNVFTAVFDRFRVEGQGRWLIKRDGLSYISSATPLPATSRHWWILMAVPEQDFIGFVARNDRTALAFSLVIVLAVVMLAALLVQQGLRADNIARAIAARGETLTRKTAAYLAISKQIAQGDAEAPIELTESLADLSGCARATVWRFDANRQVLHCCDSFERAGQGHAGGFELHRRELPAFFECIEGGEQFSTTDAASDRRCAQFQKVFMASTGTRALTVFPLRRSEQVVGAICIEDSLKLGKVDDFLPAIAAIFAASLPALAPSRHVPPAGIDLKAPARKPDGASTTSNQPMHSADLVASSPDFAQLRADHRAQISAMVLRLADSFLIAKKTRDSDMAIVTQIAEMLREIAAENEVDYLKFVGQEAIAVTGLSDGDEHAMTRMANAAISIRDRLSTLVDLHGQSVEFRIGLGFGSCFGCFLGRDQSQFNLWGEAIEIAGIMAQSAAPGGIQASAGAYDHLKQDFLFRSRGSFYMPQLGESQTYVLAGQL
jgi:class 3 adenylate cyclase